MVEILRPQVENEIQVRAFALLHESDPILKKEPLTWIFDPPQADPKLMYNIMLESMVAHSGLGLSANQIGMPVKVFVMRVSDTDAIVCFNPKIIKESEEMIMMKEGCLSFPALYLNIKRPKNISVEYQNVDGEIINSHFEGLAARIFHHEMDHMMGKTFLDKASKVLINSARKKQKVALRKGFKNENPIIVSDSYDEVLEQQKLIRRS